jgi:hypothetical protein
VLVLSFSRAALGRLRKHHPLAARIPFQLVSFAAAPPEERKGKPLAPFVCAEFRFMEQDARMEELIKDIIYSEKYQDDTYEYR